jgi:rhodanese-related sulfurtransferase
VHVPLSVLEWRVDPSGIGVPDLARAEHLILLCNEGFSSSLAAAWLHDLGLTKRYGRHRLVRSVAGGWLATGGRH